MGEDRLDLERLEKVKQRRRGHHKWASSLDGQRVRVRVRALPNVQIWHRLETEQLAGLDEHRMQLWELLRADEHPSRDVVHEDGVLDQR